MGSREFSGKSPLGATLNKISGSQTGAKSNEVKTVTGKIVGVKGQDRNQGEYLVIVRLDSGLITKPIPLSDPSGFLSANFGKPEDLVGNYDCTITYSGDSVNRGTAKITENVRDAKEAAQKFNELKITGSAFAPPGSGMI